MDKADRRKVEKKALETVLQEGIDFYVDVNNQTFWHKVRILKRQHHFYIMPLVMGTLIKISEILLEIDFAEKISKENWMTTGISAMAKHTDRLLDIVSLAIHNNEGKPNRKIKNILRRNATPTEIMALITYVVTQMNVSDFMTSIITVKGMSLVEKEEIIASGA